MRSGYRPVARVRVAPACRTRRSNPQIQNRASGSFWTGDGVRGSPAARKASPAWHSWRRSRRAAPASSPKDTRIRETVRISPRLGISRMTGPRRPPLCQPAHIHHLPSVPVTFSLSPQRTQSSTSGGFMVAQRRRRWASMKLHWCTIVVFDSNTSRPNFHPLEVAGRCRETKLPVGDKFKFDNVALDVFLKT